MTGPRPSPPRLLAALRWALALALLWAGLPGSGVMPARGADGGLAFVLCTGEGDVLVTLGPDGAPVPVEEGPGGRGEPHPAAPCAFAASVPAPAPPPPGLLWTLPDGTAVAAEAPPEPRAPAPLRLALAPHLPRGPPAA